MPEYPNLIDNGFRFTHGIADIEEMINQIELYLKTKEKNYYLHINDIRINFDEFKYEKSDFSEGDNLYEFSFLKNNDVIAYFEAYDNFKFECHLSNNVLCEIRILEPEKIEEIKDRRLNMDRNYLITYTNYEGNLNYAWFETEAELSEFIDCNSVKILECIKIIEAEDLMDKFKS